MSWIGLTITITYLVIGFKRLPVYYKRIDEHAAKEYPNLHKETGMEKSTAWCAIALSLFWIWYEIGRIVQNYVIHSATAEERKQAEYEKAAKIVADYKENQEKIAKETFDRELRGGA